MSAAHDELFKSTTAGHPNPAMAAWLNMLPSCNPPPMSPSHTSTRTEKPSSRNHSPQAATNRRKTLLAALPTVTLAPAPPTARDQQSLLPEPAQPLRPASWHPSSDNMQVTQHQHAPPPPLPVHLPHLTGHVTASPATLEPLPHEFHPLYDAAFLAIAEPARAPTHLDYFELSGSPAEQAGQSSKSTGSDVPAAESDFSACSKHDSSLATSLDSTGGQRSFLASWTSWAESAREKRLQEGGEVDTPTDLVGLGLYEQQAPSTLWESSFDAPVTTFEPTPFADPASHSMKLEESWHPHHLQQPHPHDAVNDYTMDCTGNSSTPITPALPSRSLLREAHAYRSLLNHNAFDDAPLSSGALTPIQTLHQPRGEYVVPFGHAAPLGNNLQPILAQPPRQFDFPGGPYLLPPPRPSQMNAFAPQPWLPQPHPPTMHPGHAHLAQLAQQAIAPTPPPQYGWQAFSYDHDPSTHFFF